MKPTCLIAAAVFMSVVSDLWAQTNLSYITRISLPSAAFSVALSGKYVYVGGGTGPGGNSVHIFDVSEPSNPVDVGYVDSLGGCVSFVVAGQSLYRMNGSGGFGSVTILTLANPTNPVPAGTINGTFYEMKASGTKVYLVGYIGSDFGLHLFDTSNPANPVRLASFTNSNAYPLPSTMIDGEFAATYDIIIGWLVYSTNTTIRDTMAVPLTYFNAYHNDAIILRNVVYCSGSTNVLNVYDVSDLSLPALTFKSVFNDCHELAISGNYLYSVGLNGFAVWDISAPLTAVLLGLGGTYYGAGVAVTNGYAYVADYYGLSVYSLGNPSPPPLSMASVSGQLKFSWPTPNPAFAVQQNPDLNSSNWTTLTNVPVVVGINNQVTIPKQGQRMFYRLVSQ